MRYLQRSFTVPVQVEVSQERWDEIFRDKGPGIVRGPMDVPEEDWGDEGKESDE